MNWFDKLVDVSKGLMPIISVIGSIFFPGAGQVTKALTAIPDIVQAVEKVFGDGAGPEKEAAMLATVTSLAGLGEGLSEGGQKETYARLQKLAPVISQALVAGVNTYDDPSIDSVAVGLPKVVDAARQVADEFHWSIGTGF